MAVIPHQTSPLLSRPQVMSTMHCPSFWASSLLLWHGEITFTRVCLLDLATIQFNDISLGWIILLNWASTKSIPFSLSPTPWSISKMYCHGWQAQQMSLSFQPFLIKIVSNSLFLLCSPFHLLLTGFHLYHHKCLKISLSGSLPSPPLFTHFTKWMGRQKERFKVVFKYK